MAYNITQTNGAELISGGLADGTIDTTNTSLTLVGKNYPGYGTFLNQNMVRMVENFANGSSPTGPLPGQLWWDTSAKLMKINTATTKGSASQAFKSLATMTSSTSAPSNPVTGEQWWDTSNLQLKVYNGTSWTTVGPAATSSTGNTGAIPDTIIATSPSATYVVLKMYIDNTLAAIWSKESSFTTAVTGFATVKPGLNLSTSISDVVFNGKSTDSDKLGGVAAASYFLAAGGTISGATTISTDAGLTVDGSAGSGIGQLLVSGNDVELKNNFATGNVVMYAGGSEVLKLDQVSGLPITYGNPTASSNGFTVATKNYVDTFFGGGVGNSTFTANVVPSVNNTYTVGNVSNKWSNVHATAASVTNSYATNMFSTTSNVATVYVSDSIMPTSNATVNLGSSGQWFNTFYGVSIQAKYADLAERFASDQAYPAGTVVALGGVEEITAAADALSEDVFGVISTKAAYLMNGAAGSDETHPPVAVNGRVPVRVIGKIKKGDRLVAAGNGLAKAGTKSEITPWNVIGRSLETKQDDGEGTVEAIVKLNS